VNAKARHVVRVIAALLFGVAIAGAPALTVAQHGFGGGGGGHFSGGHFGGHVGGSAGHFAGGHFTSGAGHYAYGGGHYAYGGAHGYSGYSGHYVAPHYTGAGHYVPGYGYGHPGAPYAYGYWHGGHPWVGGYWNGVFWPHVWYYPGWSWFLPVLPLGYATFWWGGVPYYYSNSLYYTWNPGYNGYVVSDPPPSAGDEDSAGSAAGDYDQAAPAPAPGVAPNGAGAAIPPNGAINGSTRAAGDVYLYPRNGQSDAQSQNDRYECHSWAVNQTGFDPTRSTQQGGNAADYRRAMIACLDARGYSAR
jgi:hypothetical protein